jgi:hypothetical protein
LIPFYVTPWGRFYGSAFRTNFLWQNILDKCWTNFRNKLCVRNYDIHVSLSWTKKYFSREIWLKWVLQVGRPLVKVLAQTILLSSSLSDHWNSLLGQNKKIKTETSSSSSFVDRRTSYVAVAPSEWLGL